MPRFDDSREGLHLDRTRRNPLAGLLLRAPISCRGTDRHGRALAHAVDFFLRPRQRLFFFSSSGDARGRIHGITAGERGSVRGMRVSGGRRRGMFPHKHNNGIPRPWCWDFFVSRFFVAFFPGPWRSVPIPSLNPPIHSAVPLPGLHTD